MAVKEAKEEVKKPSPSDIAFAGVEENEKPSGEVVIEIDDKGQAIKPVKKEEKPVEEYVRKDELEKERRRIAYEVRRASEDEARKLKAEIEELKRQKVQPVIEKPVSEWDKKVQENWKGTVEELADARFEAKLKEHMEKERVARVQQEEYNQTQTVFRENVVKATTKHPELNDPTSEKSEIFRNILEKNQRWKNVPDGPILVMREMEDELRSRGVLDEPAKAAVETEVVRRARTNATSVKAGSNSNGNKIVLTKDERDLCDHNGWKYESYAQSKAQLSKSREFEA